MIAALPTCTEVLCWVEPSTMRSLKPKSPAAPGVHLGLRRLLFLLLLLLPPPSSFQLRTYIPGPSLMPLLRALLPTSLSGPAGLALWACFVKSKSPSAAGVPGPESLRAA